MISVGDAVLKLGVDASGLNKGLKEAETQVTQSLDKMKTSLKVVGTAFTAVGIAAIKMASDARKINAQLSSTAITIGTTTGEMRKMVLELANVSTGIDEVTRTFELLARAGVRNREEMVANAEAFDTLGDAIGLEADIVADILIPAFKVFGLDLPKTAEDLDKFTWLVKNTTVDLSEFGSVMQFVAMYGADLGITLDDMIGIMAALEARGITGSAATRLFRTAVNQAEEGAVSLNEVLGVTQEQIDGYNKIIKSSTGLTREYADAAEQQYGIMDNLKFQWQKMSFMIGSVLTPLEPLFALMTAMGPVMIFLSTSVGRSTIVWIAHAAAVIKSNIASIAHTGSTAALATTQTVATGTTVGLTFAQRALNAAMMAMPLIAIIAGITALVMLGIHLYRNWNTASISIDKAWLRLKNTISGGLPTYQAQMDALELELAWQNLAKVVKDNYDQIVSDVGMAFGQMKTDAKMAASEATADAERSADEIITNAERVRDEEKGILDQRLGFYRELTVDRLLEIDKQMVAELALIDPDLGKRAQVYMDMLGGMEEADKERNRGIEEDQVAALTKELEHGENITAARERELEDQIADITDRWETEVGSQELYTDIMSSNYEGYFEGQKTLADEEFEHKKKVAEQWLVDYKTLIDAGLLETQSGYDAELEAFKKLWNVDKPEAVEAFVDEYNRIMEGAGIEPTVELVTPKGPAPVTTRKRPSNPLEAARWILEHFQAGGIIREPTLLYGLTSQRPYGIAGEAGREVISPVGAGGVVNNFNIAQLIVREDADVYKIARELKELQDRTERRVGLRGG